MVVGVGRLVLRLAENSSLKGKRRVVKAIKDRVTHHHRAAVAEVADQDKWQRAVLGLAVVGNDHAQVNSRLDKIVDFVESLHLAEVLDAELEIIHFSE
ncbi:MAG: DUF503 domain-containing protein [Proteobacteria bacterium]|nr:DUF503 domain-containing protein [Pseudomonadota bacterium]MBU1742531.1 DUF503 domain-containing protein [Pseudomonadota bacterium]